ncbi:hypothetical protein [Roseateles sp. BYS96W]|uniref:Peptidase A2 domain-containing protein n=1 Tax=Pelomonas nitida TaxID=3299027 RepID=A0ABW7G7U7_9BURK
MTVKAPRLLVGLAAFIATAGLSADAPTQPPAFLPFHWHVGSLGGLPPTPLALLVPVTLGERTCDMQLDTGANSALIWHSATDNDGPRRPLRLRLGELEARAEVGLATQRAIDECTPGSAVGTLGNAFFEHGTLTLDIPRQRLAWQTGSTLDRHPNARRFFYATPPADGGLNEGGHIFIELDARRAGKGYGMLDTGAASAEIGALDARWWTQLTGSAALQGQHITSFIVNSWSRSLECVSAPTVDTVGIDDFGPVARRTTYCPALAFRPTVHVIGLVGMAPFMHSVLTIDYPSRRWLVEAAIPSP